MNNTENALRDTAKALELFEQVWPLHPFGNKSHAFKWFAMAYAGQQQRIDEIEANLIKLEAMIKNIAESK